MPDAILQNHDWIVSIGGTQSNHCRAVSAVAARVGLRCAHVLRKDSSYREDKPLEGNLFFHKLFGVETFLISKDEYVSKGQDQLLKEAGERLVAEYGAKNPYLMPVGGSVIKGAFGYIEFMNELAAQLEESGIEVDELIFSCGSGGTAAGIAIGKYLSSSPVIKKMKITGYTACDTPEWFHEHVNEMLAYLGLDKEVKSEELLRLVQAKGVGYAVNTEEEYSLIRQVAQSSGVVLDGSYTGKAINGFVSEAGDDVSRCMFVHTGGIFSLLGQENLFKQ